MAVFEKELAFFISNQSELVQKYAGKILSSVATTSPVCTTQRSRRTSKPRSSSRQAPSCFSRVSLVLRPTL